MAAPSTVYGNALGTAPETAGIAACLGNPFIAPGYAVSTDDAINSPGNASIDVGSIAGNDQETAGYAA
jgi:hypothetical protein